jgi:hypothetical protein
LGTASLAMRRAALTTLAVAAGTLALIAGSGFAIQAATLGRPGRGPDLVVSAVAHLVAYHGSTGTITIDGHSLSETCTQRWYRSGRVATVQLGNGETLRELGTRLPERSRIEVDELELAGCPRPLTHWLASQLNRGSAPTVSAVTVFGQHVYRVAFPGSKLKLDLYISRRHSFPVGLRISGHGISGVSELSYGQAPTRRSSFPWPRGL